MARPGDDADRRCDAVLTGYRCQRPSGHSGLHRHTSDTVAAEWNH